MTDEEHMDCLSHQALLNMHTIVKTSEQKFISRTVKFTSMCYE